jgi:endonuclease V-like protein UPF0215 family
MARRLSHTIGFDDAPFSREHRGDVMLIATVFAATRMEGVLSGKIRRDGRNATDVITQLAVESRFGPQLHAILLQGITFAGFNVVDLQALHRGTGLPVLVVSRRRPDLPRIRQALLRNVRGGQRKWRLIEAAGPMEALAGVYVQRAGITAQQARVLLTGLAIHGKIPEPLRIAHMIASGLGAAGPCPRKK